MSDAGVSNLVLFIASLLVAASVAGVFSGEVGRLSENIDDLGLDASDKMRADVTVISDVGSQVYDIDGSGALRIYVKNTGTRTLLSQPDHIDVLIDNEYQPNENLTVTVLEGSDWTPGRVVRIEVAVPGLAEGTHRAQVGVDGDTEVMEFTV